MATLDNDGLVIDREQKIKQTLVASSEYYGWDGDKISYAKKIAAGEKLLDERPDEVIDAVYEAIQRKDTDPHIIFHMAINRHYTEIPILETIAFQKALHSAAHSTDLLRGLRCYEKILPVMEDYSKSTGMVRKHVAALLAVVRTLTPDYGYRDNIDHLPLERIKNKDNKDILKLAGYSLPQLIIEHPEQAEQIGKIILERKTSDPELIRSIITSDARSLSEGAL